ncbi:MAG: M23 family metallopeptidase [Lachnospiraceae bacterium]|nr:M23 family metallopeptidase [Lachnospiraceae bacterium]
MNNNDTTLLQKIKDNAFYIALGVGLLAVVTLVAIYTMNKEAATGTEDTGITDYSYDVSDSKDYRDYSADKRTTENKYGYNMDKEDELSNIPDTKATDKLQKKNIQVPETSEPEDIPEDEKTVEQETSDEDNKLPVTADTGELNFGSDKTLTWPVEGAVILPFSMETTVYYKTLDQYKCNPGVLIAAGGGSTVKSAYLGKVTKVTSDNTYGNMVTMYIGNDYSIVYGQLDTIYVKEGDYVKAGESIGTVGKPTDSFADEGNHLYFQMLQGDTPVDPMTFME